MDGKTPKPTAPPSATPTARTTNAYDEAGTALTATEKAKLTDKGAKVSGKVESRRKESDEELTARYNAMIKRVDEENKRKKK